MSRKSQNVINWRKRTKERIVEAMGGSCQICGYDRCLGALELHHLDSSTKEFGFGGIRANPRSIDLIKEELKKCVLLCANCHREIHADISQLPVEFKTFDETKMITEIKEKIVLPRKDRRKLKLSDEEFLDKLNNLFEGNKSEMARQYNVSETAIRKKLAGIK